MDNLLNKDPESLYLFLVSLPYSEEKRKIMMDPKIKEKFFVSNEGHYPFVWLVQLLKDDSINDFFDDTLFDMLFKDDRCFDKINAILSSNNSYIGDGLCNEKLFKYIVNEPKIHRKTYLDNNLIKFNNKLIEYIINNDISKIYLIQYFGKEYQKNVLNDQLLVKLQEQKIDLSFITSLDVDLINELLKKPDISLKFVFMEVQQLVKMIERGVTLPPSLNTYELIEYYLRINDTDEYRFQVNKLFENNYDLYQKVNMERNKYYQSDIRIMDEVTNLLPEYQELYDDYPEFIGHHSVSNKTYNEIKKYSNGHSKEELLAYLTKLNNKDLFKMISDGCFEENSYNLFKNLEEMINYTKASKENIIDPNYLELYKLLVNYENIASSELVSIYQNLSKNKEIIEHFYDDYRNLKNSSYSNITNNTITSKDINSSNKIVNGIKVKELNGEPFTSIIHTSGSSDWNYSQRTTSMSVIGDTSIGYYHSENKELVHFGFNKVNIDQIIHVYHTDSFSMKDLGSEKISELHTRDSLLEKTSGYNELLVKQNSNGIDGNFAEDVPYITPDYIVSFDNITDLEKKAAKENGLPILLIHTNKYKLANGSIFDENEYSDESHRKTL